MFRFELIPQWQTNQVNAKPWQRAVRRRNWPAIPFDRMPKTNAMGQNDNGASAQATAEALGLSRCRS